MVGKSVFMSGFFISVHLKQSKRREKIYLVMEVLLKRVRSSKDDKTAVRYPRMLQRGDLNASFH